MNNSHQVCTDTKNIKINLSSCLDCYYYYLWIHVQSLSGIKNALFSVHNYWTMIKIRVYWCILYWPAQDSNNDGVLRSDHKCDRHRRRQVSELHVGVAGRDPGVLVELDGDGRLLQENVTVLHARAERFHLRRVQPIVTRYVSSYTHVICVHMTVYTIILNNHVQI